MREIKFRGKRIDNGEWVYGYFAMLPQPSTAFLFIKPYIILSYFDYEDECGFKIPYLVDENTIGQFTGLYDKNGKEIYEGDVVKLFYYDGNSKDQLGNVKGIDKIIFVDGCFKLENENTEHPIGYDILGKCRFIEVIANIHEEVK